MVLACIVIHQSYFCCDQNYVDWSYLCFSFQAIAALALNSGCPFKEGEFQEEMLELKKEEIWQCQNSIDGGPVSADIAPTENKSIILKFTIILLELFPVWFSSLWSTLGPVLVQYWSFFVQD